LETLGNSENKFSEDITSFMSVYNSII